MLWSEATTTGFFYLAPWLVFAPVIGLLVKLALYAALLLLILQNLGVNVTTLIAGLGVGGIAIALAMQNVLGDLFASLMEQKITPASRNFLRKVVATETESKTASTATPASICCSWSGMPSLS